MPNNQEKTSRPLHVAVLLSLAAGLVPVLFYLAVFHGVEQKDAQTVRSLLLEPDSRAALVDVSESGEFDRSHICGSVNWPLDAVLAMESVKDIPQQLQGRTLYFTCEAGIASARAARAFSRATGQPAFNVRYGIQKWGAGLTEKYGEAYACLESGLGDRNPFASRILPLWEQWVATLAAFAAKPLYMLGAFLIILWLGKESSAPMRALKWAMVFFLAGEAFCAINYVLLGDASDLVEYLHIWGMVAAFGLAALCVYLALEEGIFRTSDPKKACALAGFCTPCAKRADAPCPAQQLFYLAAASLLLLCLIPLTAPFSPANFNAGILGGAYHYGHPILFQVFEIRIAPLLALALFAGSLAVARFSKDWHRAVPWLCAGLGFLGFSLFRLFLFGVFSQNLVWYIAWEEYTELLFIAGTGVVLWIFYKKGEGEQKAEK